MKLALFAGSRYYPNGGAEDFKGFGTEQELKDLLLKLYNDNEYGGVDWGHIADSETMQILWEFYDIKYGWVKHLEL